MTSEAALAAAATAVAMAFCLSTLERWLLRRRPHELAWTLALVMFSVASFALWWAEARGWSAPTFRVFFLFGAILNVPWLALGTVYLLGGPRLGDRVRWVLAVLSGFAAGVLLMAPMKGPVPADELPEGSELFGVLPRVLAAVGSGVGALVLIGGAVVSAWRLVRGRARSRAAAAPAVAVRRLALGNVLIATGTLILSASGSLAGRLGADRAFAVTLAVGVTVLFAGFLVATPSRRRAGETLLSAARA